MSNPKVALIALLICNWLVPPCAADQVSRLWRVSAGAEFIVVGTLNVPINEIRADIAAGSRRYIDIQVSVETVLKGELSPVFAVRHFTRKAPYNISNETLIGLNGQRALLFLVRGPDGIYFPNLGSETLQPALASLISELRTEIARQEWVSRNWTSHPGSPHREEVQALVERLTIPTTQDLAVEELDALAPNAVISIIDLMDDRRRLGKPHIALKNTFPNAFEAYAQYGPQMVIDVCVAMLGRATRASFFPSIVNGGSERERQLAVVAWRVYADVVLNHPNELGLPPN